MIYLSESKYCQVWQGQKMAWLKKHYSEKETQSPASR